MEQLVNGMSCYHVRVVCLKDWDADTLIRDLEEKQKIKRVHFGRKSDMIEKDTVKKTMNAEDL